MTHVHPFITLILGRIPVFRIMRIMLWCLLMISIVAYAYFLVLSVTHVVLREELSLVVHEEQSRISELETQYLAKIALLSEDLATDMGLVPVRSTGYVAIGGVEKTLTRVD
ncbi:MAG: hypothetical protein KBD21_01110 [Candidatus Pacebacteria bacterium]|nr:hypothetical protein [Candidatus Paceibacterota bacterium]